MRQLIGSYDVVWITLDSLRYDVAQSCHAGGMTTNLSRVFPQGWERRHAPGNFTLPSHLAMFSGFLPTPLPPSLAAPLQDDISTFPKRKPARLFAPRIPGVESVSPNTFMFDEESVPEALGARGYRTTCIGGVGFFNKTNPVGSVLPSYFQDSHWKPSFGPGRKESVKLQTDLALDVLEKSTLSLLFLNVSATHHPTHHYLAAGRRDTTESQAAALAHVDQGLGPLLDLLIQRRHTRPSVLIVSSDHGDSFGEDGYFGHCHSHPTVTEIPYAHTLFDSNSWEPQPQ